MKSQRAWMTTLSTIVALWAGASTAMGQFPSLHPTPGFHPAAGPQATMLGQEYYDPTWAGAMNYGDACYGPNWYDVSVDAIYLTRDDAGRNLPIASDGIAGLGVPNAVLSTGDLDLDYEPGIQATARYQMSAVFNIEARYLGVLDWEDHRVATSDNDSLYSWLSDFGNQPFGGFADVDQATLMSVRYTSHIDSVELNVRRTWARFNHRIHGSWLSGFRWVKLSEQVHFFSDVQPHSDPINGVERDAAQANYLAKTANNLYGGQLGAQLGASLLPGLNLSSQIKGGVYGAQGDLNTFLTTTSTDGTLVDSGDSTDVAFVGEASAYVSYQVRPWWKVRVGYQVLYLEGVTLATENFNAQPGAAGRLPINDNGSALLHGALLGTEIGW
jgi:hypothetical protein